MPKPKNYSSLKDAERDISSRTQDLYHQAAGQMPPMGQPLPQGMVHPMMPQGMMMQPMMQQPRRRSKPQSIIPRQNGKLLFMEEEHNEAIEKIHWTSRVDRQDVIRAAVQNFLERHFNGERLDAEGEQIVKAYYHRTHPEY